MALCVYTSARQIPINALSRYSGALLEEYADVLSIGSHWPFESWAGTAWHAP